MGISNFPLDKKSRQLLIKRQANSKRVIRRLRSKLAKTKHASAFSNLTIYTAGSYSRLEAGDYSDIDLFLMVNADPADLKPHHISEIRVLAEIVDVIEKMKFPPFSNDGEFLKILFVDEMLNNLGSRDDDHLNYFTARMLLLLESHPIFGDEVYGKLIEKTVRSYFRDYPYHPKEFKPTFLINDIIRFWKTVCLNYENKRNQLATRSKIKHKIRNFKLGHS